MPLDGFQREAASTRPPLGSKRCGYLQVSEDRVLLDAREQHPHGVGPVVQERDPSSVQIAGQLVDIRLELGEGCHRNISDALTNQFSPYIRLLHGSPQRCGTLCPLAWAFPTL